MSHIIYSITLVARDVSHALALAAELRANGVESTQISAGIAHTSAPVAQSTTGKGPNEREYNAKYGTLRLTPNIERLCGLTGTREDKAAKFTALRDSGDVIKDGAKYLLNGQSMGSDGEQAQGESVQATRHDFSDINEEECV